MKRILFIFCCLACSAGILSAEELNIPYCEESPVIDGNADETVWSRLPWQEGFFRNGTGEKAEVQTRFKVFHDGRRIYAAVECAEPAMDRIVRNDCKHDSQLLWRNDSIELNLVPDLKAFSFYKLIIDSAGVFADMQGVDDNTDRDKYNFFPEWESGAQVRVRRGDGMWLAEIAVPLGAMDFDRRTTTRWRFNIARNRYAGAAAEMSSWSPLPSPGQTAPKLFREVEFDKLPVKRFLLEVEDMNYEFGRSPDGGFSFSATATVHNHTGGFALFNQKLNLIDRQSGKVFSGNTRESVNAGAYKKLTGSAADVKPGNYLFNYELWSANSNPYLLKRVSRPVTLEYMPVSIRLHRPAYRNNLYATMPDQTIEAQVELREGAGIALTAELTGENGFREVRRIEASPGNDRVRFDGHGLADGPYILRVSGEKDGRTLAAEVKIRKLPYRKGEVWLDRDGVTHVDGEPFLPFGWYGTKPEQPGSWINNVLLLTRFANPEQAVETVEANLKTGQRTLLVPFQDLDPRGWVPPVIFKDPDTRKKGLNEEQRKKITEFVVRAGQAEGLLAWYMADEPEGRDNNPRFYEEALELLCELDPYHPCVMLNYGIQGMRKYYRGCDILMPDCYPQYFEDGSTGKALWSTSEWIKAATALRPAWLMPQMALWPAYSPDRKLRGTAPDYFDQRSQVFQALIHNAKGFNLYSWHYSQIYSSLIIGPDAIGQTLEALKAYLLKNSVPDGVTVKTAPEAAQFQAGVKELDGRLCVIAVNTAEKTVQAEIKLSSGFTGELAAAGEQRTVSVKNGVFKDHFAPKETHVYLTDGTLANRVPNVRDTVAAIEAHRAGRRKKGNLIGMGEMLEAQYLEFAAGKIPPEVPKLKASSDAVFHGTRRTGSLYYLLDGLTEPNRVEYSWSPAASDRQPYLEIVLPYPMPLHELKLYTPNGNLTACRVIAGGRTHEVRDNRDEILSVPLGGETADLVRIEITQRKEPSAAAGKPAGKRLLTEVELY